MIKEASGDDSFKKLFEEFYTDLYKVAWRICGRHEIAEELTQEAFLRYYNNRERLPEGREVRYWLIRVVKNLAFNYEKKRSREKDALRFFVSGKTVAAANDGEQTVLESESAEEVRRALLQVPYKFRVVLILKEYSGYRYSEIARILKISESNVKVRVFRARAMLTGILNKGADDVS